MDLTPEPLDQLLELLATVGVHTSMDPAEVNLPGGWLALDEVRMTTVAGSLELRCSLFLICGDRDARRAIATLAPLYNAVRTVVRPDGPVLTQGVVMPDSPTPLPALRVPVYLYT